MHIALAGHHDSDIAHPLAEALGVQLISATNALEPSARVPSDDIDIQLIIEKIMRNTGNDERSAGYLLNNYPVNITQAQSLDMALAQAGQPIAIALMIDSTKIPQNSANKALIRYYRSQNKIILIDESSSIEDICGKLYSIHEKRRSDNSKPEQNRK